MGRVTSSESTGPFHKASLNMFFFFFERAEPLQRINA